MATSMRYIFILSFLFTALSFTQPNEDMPRSRQMQFVPISFEAVPFWSEDTTVVEVAIFYRIHPEFFFFAKTTNAQHEIYEANGELVFELFDEKDIACNFCIVSHLEYLLSICSLVALFKKCLSCLLIISNSI